MTLFELEQELLLRSATLTCRPKGPPGPNAHQVTIGTVTSWRLGIGTGETIEQAIRAAISDFDEQHAR